MKHGRFTGMRNLLAAAALGPLLGSCGGDDSNISGGGGGNTPPPFTSVTQVRVSQAVSLAPNCDGAATDGTLFPGTVVEGSLAVNPANAANLVATWQQNRWSSGGSQAIGVASSIDGGNSWTASTIAFSRCTGGSSANAGDYARTSNAWVSVGPSGTAWALALSFTGELLQNGSTSGMLVAQSGDGGYTWSLPVALIQDGTGFFNDKGAITADPTDGNFVYAVWDRLAGQTGGPSYFSETANAGSTWTPARSIYDPGANNQTIGNIIVVLPSGQLIDFFNEIDTASDGTTSSAIRSITSADHGVTWSTTPVNVAALTAVGTTDPYNGGAVRDSSLLFTAAVGPTGNLYLAWQDARFSQGDHDGIAFAQSTDGGASWSAPVEVNTQPAVAAFTPTLDVRADGTIAITYFDLRNDTTSVQAGGLYADGWMVVSGDGLTFTESHLSGSFDLRLAPKTTQGYFLGDYQGLGHQATAFLPFYAQPPNSGSVVSTDVFVSFPPATAAAASARFAARPAPSAPLSAAASARVSAHLHAMRAQRLKGGV